MAQGRLILIALMALFALPPLAGAWAQQWWRPTTHAYGTLLEPGELHPDGLLTTTGERFDTHSLRGKWVVIQVAAHDCDAACRQGLYLARQARTAQGRDSGRIERLLIAARTITVPDDADLRQVRSVGPTPPLAAGLYLMDPLGRVMMRYPDPPDGAGLIKDLRRLLKTSHIG